MIGLGWRPETAWVAQTRKSLGFVEIVAESFPPGRPIPIALRGLVERGIPIVVHGVSLSLGGSERPDPARLERLAELATDLRAPLVSEHLAFVRGGGREVGHLLPIARTREVLDIVVENVELAQKALPVPLVLENVAALFQWPDAEMDEATFLAEILRRTGARLLLDVSNLYANAHNFGFDPGAMLDAIPADRIAYVHVAGGVLVDGVVHDTHAHPLLPGPLQLLDRLLDRTGQLPVLLEKDGNFGSREELEAELDAIGAIAARDGHRGERRVA